MYNLTKLARIYSTYGEEAKKIGFHPAVKEPQDAQREAYRDTILLSDKAESALGAGEKGLSDTKLYPKYSENANDSIMPGETFVIPAMSSGNCTISANISNQQTGFTNGFASKSYTAAANLQILPADTKTLTFTGDNSNFVGDIIIGDDNTAGGIIAFGDSNVEGAADEGSTTKALGGYESMTVKDNATVSLAGGDAVTIKKDWTFYGTAKLTASKRITLDKAATMIFGASEQEEP